MKYDVVIKAHNKDYHKLELVVDSLKYLNPEPENIYILTQDGFYPKNTIFDEKIVFIKDEQVTPYIDRSRLTHRPNWNWINLVSILQEFTENDLYLDVQSDNFFTKPIDLFDDQGRPKLFQSTVNPGNNKGHRPYFEFSENVFGLEKVSDGYSYIIEFLMYDRKLLKELFKKFSSTEEMLEVIYSNVNDNSYPADQEIFGNLVEKHFPEKYCFVPNAPVYLDGVGDGLNVSQEYLKEYIKQVKIQRPDVIACSHHTWI
jgi:hypothetical protein